MSQNRKSICVKICDFISCKCYKSKKLDIPPKLPEDISATLSDANLSGIPNKKYVNSIKEDYKTQYGTNSKEVKKEQPKPTTGQKIRLSIDNDYIRKSSDNLGEINSPRKSEV